jgi:hypothetical protein
MSKKRLECIVFLKKGKWVKADDETNVVNPKPIGSAFVIYYCYDDGISQKEIEETARYYKKHKGKGCRKANAYSIGGGNPLAIQLHEI